MIVRIVKMTFRPGKEEEFLEVFAASRDKIRASAGCTHLELLRDIAQPNVFFTYSHWDKESSLQAYRNSALFRDIWGRTSLLFQHKAEAWSLEKTAP